MTDENNNKPVDLKDAANTGFSIQIGAAPSGNLPAVTTGNPVAGASAGGLSYATAHADEKAEMEKIIAGIDLTDSKTIEALGSEERQQLATLADQILDSIQPSVRLAFAEALAELIEAIKSNSLDNIKKAIRDGAVQKVGKALWNTLSGKDNNLEQSKEMIGKFMTNISGSRKTITEMTDKLMAQKIELDKNFTRINEMGYAITVAAQRMRVVRAATAEFIRRIESGEITVLEDLTKIAENGRSDDVQKLRDAQSGWNNLRVADGDLLGSINIYDMNVANLAFTKDANVQNRMKTSNILTNTIAEWKTQLAIFAMVATENAATQLIGAANQLSAAAVKQNKDLFDTLVDSVTAQTAQGTHNLRQIMQAQNDMATKLESVGPIMEKQFAQLAADKIVLETSAAEFHKRVTKVYSNKSGVLSTPAPAPKLG